MTQPPPIPARPIDYAGPQTAPRDPAAKRRAMRIAIGIFFDAAAFTALMVLTRRFEQIFKDFKTDLPLITKLLLTFERAFLDSYGWVVFWLLIALAIVAVCIVRPSMRSDPDGGAWMRRITNLLLMLGWVIPALVAVIGLFAPMINLIQSVSGPGK